MYVRRGIICVVGTILATASGLVQAFAQDPPDGNAKRGDLQALWSGASFAQLMARRAEDRASIEPMAAEKLALAAVFVGDAGAVDELEDELKPSSPVAAFIGAYKSLQEGKPSPTEAAGALRKLIEAWQPAPGDEELLKLNAEGFALSRMGLRAQAFATFRKARESFPKNGVALRNLATMYLSADMPDFGVAILRVLTSEHGDDAEVRQLYYETLVNLNRESDAQTFAEGVYARMPEDPQTVLNLARIYLNRGDVAVAGQVLRQAVEDSPGQHSLRVTLAGAQIRAGEYAAALATLDSAAVPVNLAGSAREVRLFAHAGLGQWEEVLKAAAEGNPEDATLAGKFLKVAALITSGRAADAAGTLPGIDGDKQSAADPVAILAAAIGAGIELADPLDAALVAALRKDPAVSALFSHGMACGMARLYDRGFDIMTEVRALLPDDARVAVYALDALVRAKNADDRAGRAGTIAAKFPSQLEVQLSLAAVQKSLADVEGQRAALEKALSLSPDNRAVMQRLAMFAVDQHDDKLALRIYEAMLKIAPDNPTILNNLAYYLLQTKGDAKRARDYAAEALKQQPNSPNVMHTLGLAQLREGELEAAQKNLAFALQLRPGDPTLTLDYGQLLIRTGKEEEGRRFVQSALAYATQLGLDFPRRAEAEAILQENPAD